MAYSVFLSHSMTEEDQPFVRAIADTLASQSIKCYIAERETKAGQPLAAKIEQAIRDCDCLVALLTKGGHQSAYVNQEIGYATASQKPVIPIVEKGITVTGLKTGVEWVEFDRANPQGALLKLTPYLVKLASGKELAGIVGILILAALAAWCFKK